MTKIVIIRLVKLPISNQAILYSPKEKKWHIFEKEELKEAMRYFREMAQQEQQDVYFDVQTATLGEKKQDD